MRVEIRPDTVTKMFKAIGGGARRYRLEKLALQRLEGLRSFPKIIKTDDSNLVLVMSRLPGKQPDSLDEHQTGQLRSLLISMLDRGVARHAIPLRDLLLSDTGRLSMVDFERVTLRTFAQSPVWKVASLVCKYHVLRHIRCHQPHTLSQKEHWIVNHIDSIRHRFAILKPFRQRLKRFRRRIFGRGESRRMIR